MKLELMFYKVVKLNRFEISPIVLHIRYGFYNTYRVDSLGNCFVCDLSLSCL